MTSWDATRKLKPSRGVRHWTTRLVKKMDVPEDWGFTALATRFSLTSYVGEKLAGHGSSQIASMLLHNLIPRGK
jgi:hypothetical protein